MIYKKISGKDYLKLQDKTGAYLLLWPNGSKSWYLNGLYHRENGPAIEWADGRKNWWVHGTWYKTEEEWEIAKIKDQIV